MASDLIAIASSGARAARAALDVSAQNIANAATPGYVRRSIDLSEVAGTRNSTTQSDVSLAGVRIAGITRNADAFRQSDVRRTGSDTARADTELSGLTQIESSVENSGIYDALTGFESALQQLGPDPTNASLRSAVIEQGRTLAGGFRIAAQELVSVGKGLQFDAQAGVSQVNDIATQLALTNARIVAVGAGTSDQTALADQRDQLLDKLSKLGDVTTTFAANGTVQVQLGGSSGPNLVAGVTASTLTAATNPNGTLAYAIGVAPVSFSGGSLAGANLALTKLDTVSKSLDTIAASIISTVNTAQSSGVALDGTAGQPLFTGTNALTFDIAAVTGSAIATAPAGAGAQSRNAGNLTALKTALTAADPSGQTNALLFDVSATVASNTTTRDALKTISDNAKTALAAQSGVNLDDEAVNLVRYQQAFQASGKVIQVAQTLFETLLNLR
ncbi:flagellar hook-associated protein FlgK [Novosphingobium sp.]|uniref:flagellar hook-associated protein FlgK n=1 Tax=Novosphingobium sp. TaxID=1874826 RepID=UPI0025F28CBE|nr:flagellar hook-associated protein FlgK [Novosphingobium sp.]